MSEKIQLLVPKETTNIIRNPSVELNLEDWAPIGSGISRSPNEGRFGWNAVRVFTNNLDENEGVYVRSFPNTLDTIYTGSIYVKGQGRVRLRMRDGTNGLDFPGEFVNLETDPELEVPACEPNSLEFNGDTSEVNCQSDGRIDDLADNAFTAEAWIRANSFGESNVGRIFDKTGSGGFGWFFSLFNNEGMIGQIECVTADARSTPGLDEFTADGEWRHVVMTFDDAGTRFIRLFIDGIEPSYQTQNPANGAIISDAIRDLFIGNRSDGITCFDGEIGWCRISDNLRYTENFTPPGRCALPEIDAHTIAQWIGLEQDGELALVENQEGDANLDGTESNTAIGCGCSDPERGKKWRRLSVSGNTGGALSDDLRLIVETDEVQEAVFYVDGAQIEEGELTTYCDGDQPGCRWNGTFHDSTSQRNNPEFREGGLIRSIPMLDPDLYVTISSGLGMPPIRQIFQELAILPGSVFERSKALSRTIDLTFWARNLLNGQPCFPASIDRLNEIRQALIDVIKPDVVKDQQPFVLFYVAEQGTVHTSVRYDSGLEFTGDLRNPYFNSFNMRVIAESPFWNEDDQSVRVLEQSQSLPLGANGNAVVFRRDGEWSTTGEANSGITDIAFAPNGDMYVVGNFTTIGGIAANRVARWDGETWFALGVGLDAQATAVTVNPSSIVFVGGNFANAGGAPAASIASWDPIAEAWSALGAGTNGNVFDVIIDQNGFLYATGDFTTADGNPAARIARWDGGLWHPLNAGLNNFGQTLAIDSKNVIYVGGEFTSADGIAALRIAAWDFVAGTWSVLSLGMDDRVNTIDVSGDDIVYAVGRFATAGGNTVNRIAFWNGTDWFAMGDGLDNASLDSELIVLPDSTILVGGDFTKIGDLTTNTKMAFWNGSIWTRFDLDWNLPVGFGGVNGIQNLGDDIYISVASNGDFIDGSQVTEITNPGTASIFPQFRFTGPGKLVWLENLSTDDVIYFDYDAITDEEVIIDMREQIKTVTSNFRGNAISAVRPNSDFAKFSLLPGTNRIKVFIIDEVPNTQFQISLGTRHWSFDGVAA